MQYELTNAYLSLYVYLQIQMTLMSASRLMSETPVPRSLLCFFMPCRDSLVLLQTLSQLKQHYEKCFQGWYQGNFMQANSAQRFLSLTWRRLAG